MNSKRRSQDCNLAHHDGLLIALRRIKRLVPETRSVHRTGHGIQSKFSVGCINHHHVVTAGSHTGQRDVQRATGDEAVRWEYLAAAKARRVLVEFNLLIDSGQNSIRRHALELRPVPAPVPISRTAFFCSTGLQPEDEGRHHQLKWDQHPNRWQPRESLRKALDEFFCENPNSRLYLTPSFLRTRVPMSHRLHNPYQLDDYAPMWRQFMN